MNDNDQIIFKIAISNFKEKNYEESEKNFLILLKEHPKNINLLKNLSLSYFHNQKFFEAEITIKKILELNYKDKEIIFKDKIGRIRDIQVHPLNGKIYFLASGSLWVMEK